MAYHAFISYSHAADGKLAPAIQAGLQRLAKPWFRLPVIKVFRDQTSLSANPGLWSAIERSLAASEYFILLASDTAARSVWVQRELAWWMANRPVENVLIVVTDGEIEWDPAAGDYDWSRTTCVAETLRGCFREEPLFVDMRWAKDRNDLSLRHSQFRAGVLDLAAPLHRRPKDELDSEDIRQTRRLQTASWSAVIVIVLLAIGAMFAAWRAVQNANTAVRNAITAVSRQFAVESQLSIRDGRLRDAVTAALKAFRTEDTMEARTAVFQALQSSSDLRAVFQAHDAPVRAVTFRNDGKELLTWSTDNTLISWDVASRSPNRQPIRGETAKASSAAFSNDGQSLATGMAGGAVILWDVQTMTRRLTLQAKELGEITALAFNTEGTRMASGDNNADVVIWDLATSEQILIPFAREGIEHEGTTASLSFTRDGRYLAAANTNPSASVAVWEIPSGRLVAKLHPSSSFFVNESVLFFQQEATEYLAIGSSEGGVQISRMTDSNGPGFQTVNSTAQHQGGVPVMTASNGGLAAGGRDGLVSVWIQPDSPAAIPASWTKSPVESLAFSASNGYLAAGTADGTVVIYESQAGSARTRESVGLAAGQQRSPNGKWRTTAAGENLLSVQSTATGTALDGSFSSVKFSLDGRWMVTSNNAGVMLWDLRITSPTSRPLLGPGNHDVAISPASNYVIAQVYGAPMRWWDLTRSPPTEHMLPKRSDSTFRGFSPDGKIALLRSDREVVLWDLVNNRQVDDSITLPSKDEDDKYRTEFSPDGRWLITGVQGSSGALHRIGVTAPASEPFPVKALFGGDFSPDGKWFAFRTRDGAASVCSLETLKSLVEFRGKGGADFRFSIDGRWLLTKLADGTVEIRDLKSRKPTARVLPVGNLREAAISPDGRTIIAKAQDRKTVSIWDTVTFQQLGQVRSGADTHAFSSDGRRLAVAEPAVGITLVDLREGRTLAELRGHSKWIHDLAFSPDGKLLVSVDANGSVILWDPVNGRRISDTLLGEGEDEDSHHRIRFDPEGWRLRTAGTWIPAHPQSWVDEICRRVDSFRGAPIRDANWTCQDIKAVTAVDLLQSSNAARR